MSSQHDPRHPHREPRALKPGEPVACLTRGCERPVDTYADGFCRSCRLVRFAEFTREGYAAKVIQLSDWQRDPVTGEVRRCVP